MNTEHAPHTPRPQTTLRDVTERRVGGTPMRRSVRFRRVGFVRVLG
jgi:hypothetical protein